MLESKIVHKVAPWLLILAAIAVNIVVGHLVQTVLQLPLYLDSIGTILVGALFGPVLGAATGAISNVVWGLILGEPTIIPFAIAAAVIGLCAGFAALRGAFKRWFWVIVAGLLTGVLAAFVSAPISTYLFDGVIGSGADQLVSYLQATGASLLHLLKTRSSTWRPRFWPSMTHRMCGS